MPEAKGEVSRRAVMMVGWDEDVVRIVCWKAWNAGEEWRVAGWWVDGHEEVIWMVEGDWTLVPMTKGTLLWEDLRAWVSVCRRSSTGVEVVREVIAITDMTSG